mmetsp:Transcript_10814/g.37889  ORF Transcript_10814/g.37889 Transcript_10814/m.37889 type:complete len:110 (+) Transcript_10814:199-528(+)
MLRHPNDFHCCAADLHARLGHSKASWSPYACFSFPHRVGQLDFRKFAISSKFVHHFMWCRPASSAHSDCQGACITHSCEVLVCSSSLDLPHAERPQIELQHLVLLVFLS